MKWRTFTLLLLVRHLPGVWDGEGKAVAAGKPCSAQLPYLKVSLGSAVQAMRAEGCVGQAGARHSREDKCSPDSALSPGWGVQTCTQAGAALGPWRCSRGPKPRRFLSYIFAGCQKRPTEDGVNTLQQLWFIHGALPLDVGHLQPQFFFRRMDKTEELAVKSTQRKGNMGQ